MSMSCRKRLFEEIESFDSLEKPLPNASVHAAVTEISPVKKGKNANYFDGNMTDGTTNLRFVGFNTEQQKKLSSLFKSREAAHLTNCEIKRSRQGDKLEVMIKKVHHHQNITPQNQRPSA